jgi:hypothetical protein
MGYQDSEYRVGQLRLEELRSQLRSGITRLMVFYWRGARVGDCCDTMVSMRSNLVVTIGRRLVGAKIQKPAECISLQIPRTEQDK